MKCKYTDCSKVRVRASSFIKGEVHSAGLIGVALGRETGPKAGLQRRWLEVWVEKTLRSCFKV